MVWSSSLLATKDMFGNEFRLRMEHSSSSDLINALAWQGMRLIRARYHSAAIPSTFTFLCARACVNILGLSGFSLRLLKRKCVTLESVISCLKLDSPSPIIIGLSVTFLLVLISPESMFSCRTDPNFPLLFDRITSWWTAHESPRCPCSGVHPASFSLWHTFSQGSLTYDEHRHLATCGSK